MPNNTSYMHFTDISLAVLSDYTSHVFEKSEHLIDMQFIKKIHTPIHLIFLIEINVGNPFPKMLQETMGLPNFRCRRCCYQNNMENSVVFCPGSSQGRVNFCSIQEGV